MALVSSAYSGDNSFGSLDQSIERVRIFSGFTKSKGGKMITPSVVTLIVSKGTIDCRFIAFVGIPLAFKDKVKIPPEGEKIRFQGEDCPKGGDG